MNITIIEAEKMSPFEFVRAAWTAYKHLKRRRNITTMNYDTRLTNTPTPLLVRVGKTLRIQRNEN